MSRLFVAYAIGRIYSGVIGGVIGVVFITWLVQALNQQGVGYNICMVVDIIIIFTCQNLPWLILGSSAVTLIGPSVFYQARSIMLNRVMASDDLTLFRNRLDTVGIISALAGSGLGMITPVSLDVVGWLSIVFSILMIQATAWQVKELEKMPLLKLE